jgi:nitroreductase
MSQITLKLKSIVRAMLPARVYRRLKVVRRLPRILAGEFHDLRRYVNHSSVVYYGETEASLRALITALYHNIEKGLSLPTPRSGFGRDNLLTLVRYIDECIERFGPRDYLAVPISVIGAYASYHESRSFDVSEIRTHHNRLVVANAIAPSFAETGGVRRVDRDEILSAVAGVGLEFFEKRFSCRQYSDQPITRVEIETAVRAAQKSPVVCNRQSGRIYAFTSQEDIQKVLSLQGGARGFSDVVKVLFCVAVDVRNFNGVGERYQGWIDGGMFAMSLIYGLHMQGIGSCCLNWSKEPETDLAMHLLLDMPEHESIIMFIAAGHLPEDFVVAKSVRKSLREVLDIRPQISVDQAAAGPQSWTPARSGKVAHTDEPSSVRSNTRRAV